MNKRIAFVSSLLAFSATAFAHPANSGGGFSAGILHPVSGVDHVLAMIAVGLWAAQLGGRNAWRLPGAFILMMIVGGLLALAGTRSRRDLLSTRSSRQ